MKTKCKTLRVLALAAAVTLPAAMACAQTLVYDNSSHDLGFRFNPGTNEVGDEIVLAGTARFLTDFTFQYWGLNFSGNEQAVIRFYANDGSTNGLPAGVHMPGTLLFDSDWFSIIPTNRATLMFNDFVTGAAYPLTGPVPDDFTWTVQFRGIETGESAGVDLYSPPTVGTNYSDYWDNVGGQWELRASTNGVPIDFAARIDATPEPSALGLGLLGGLVFLGVRRRNSRR